MKVAKHCVFPMIWGSGGSKSRLAKAAGAEPAGQMRDEKLHGAKHVSKSKCAKHLSFGALLEVAMLKKCTPLWREAHFEVKMYKTHHVPVGPLLEVEMSKKCTPLWHEAHFEVKMYKTPQRRTTFGSWDVEKVHAVVARSTFRSQNVQNTPRSDHFWKLRCRKSARRCGAKHISKSKVQKTHGYGTLLDVQMCFRVASARDCAPWQKWAKRAGFVAFPKTLAGVGHLKSIFKYAFRVAGAVQKTCSSEMLGGQGADFLRGVAFWSIRSSGLLRWFGVTGAARRMTWHQFFAAGAILYTGGVEKSQNTLARGSQRCTQLSIYEGSLAELLCFWCCQLWKKKTSRRIVSFLALLSSKVEEVSQNCSVVKFKTWGRLAE